MGSTPGGRHARSPSHHEVGSEDRDAATGEGTEDVNGDELLRGRRAIRRYAARDVADELVTAVLDMARHAPSSMNGQPWAFVVVRESETKRALARLKNRYRPPEKSAYPADFLAEAPVIV